MRTVDLILFDAIAEHYANYRHEGGYKLLASFLNKYEENFDAVTAHSRIECRVRNAVLASESMLNDIKKHIPVSKVDFLDFLALARMLVSDTGMGMPVSQKALLLDNVLTIAEKSEIPITDEDKDSFQIHIKNAGTVMAEHFERNMDAAQDLLKEIEASGESIDFGYYSKLKAFRDKLYYHSKYNITSGEKYDISYVRNTLSIYNTLIGLIRYNAATQVMNEVELGILGNDVRAYYWSDLYLVGFVGVYGREDFKDALYMDSLLNYLYSMGDLLDISDDFFIYSFNRLPDYFLNSVYFKDGIRCIDIRNRTKLLYEETKEADTAEKCVDCKTKSEMLSRDVNGLIGHLNSYFGCCKDGVVEGILKTLEKYKSGINSLSRLIDKKLNVMLLESKQKAILNKIDDFCFARD